MESPKPTSDQTHPAALDTSKSVEKLGRSVTKEELKERWLHSLGLAEDKSVIDCDLSAQTVTFQTDDGPFTRQVAECWSRVMGYHRPVSYWNKGKQNEWRDRKFFFDPTGRWAICEASAN